MRQVNRGNQPERYMKLVPPSDPILTSVAEPVLFPDTTLSRLFSGMVSTMLEQNGVGLAAPQVGIPLRVFTFRAGREIGIAINPVITEQSEATIEVTEGCLTFPGRFWQVTRSKEVVLSYFDLSGAPITKRFGALDGLMAIIAQHECAHLDGILISQHGREKGKHEQ